MGTEAIWVPAALALASAGTSYYNQKQTAKAQNKQLTQQIQQQSQLQDEANSKIQQALAQRAASNDDSEKSSLSSEYLQALKASQAKANQGLSQSGAVSDAYKQAASNAALGVADYGSKTANLMGAIDAPTQQRQKEAIGNAQLQSDLGLIGRQSASDSYLNNLKLQSIRQNPWTTLASQGLGAAAGITAATMGGGGLYGSSIGDQATAATQANNANLYNKLQNMWAT